MSKSPRDSKLNPVNTNVHQGAQLDKKLKVDLTKLTKEDLINMINEKKLKKKSYIKKYQQTDKGRLKCIQATKKYYDANREKILKKKREYYLKKKALKEGK